MAHPNMQLRRLLLDGVNIIEPYRCVLHQSHRTSDGKIEDEAIRNEIAEMTAWLQMARATALRLKRTAQGKSGEQK